MVRVFCVSMCIVAAGCVSSRVQRLDPEVRAARAPGAIVVLEEAPEGPFTVIARIEARTGAVFESFDDLRAEVVDQAAQLGGAAVIVGPESKETDFLILTTGIIPSERKKLAGEVIVFR